MVFHLIAHFTQGQMRGTLKQKPQLKDISSIIMLIISFFIVFFQNANCQISALSSVGPLYTEQIQIGNSGSNSAAVDYSYNRWTFTSTASPIPNNYVLLSIQSISIKIDTNFLTFQITNQIVYQSSIHLEISYCQQNNGNCFTSVTIRMLAIDFDMPIGGSTYTQIMNGLYVQNVILSAGVISSIYYPSISSNLNTFAYGAYLTAFRVKGSGLNFLVPNLTLFSNYFKLDIVYQQSPSVSSSSFQILFYNPTILLSNNRFNVSGSSLMPISNASQIAYNAPPNSAFYLQGEILIFGLKVIQLATNNMDIQTVITSSRNFSSTSSLFNSNNNGAFWIHLALISKLICPPSNKFYITDLNSCNSTCPQGYYIQNVVNCYPCQNSRCLTCQQANSSCMTCDTTTRSMSFVSVSRIYDCLPQSGYYQNNLVVAASCVGNCTSCTNNIGCDTCKTTYYYTSVTNNCLLCADIFSNCTACSILSPVSCSTCQNSFYVSSGECTPCSRNCSICSDGSSCTTCLLGYYYTNSVNKCLICQDILANCRACSNLTPVTCQTCQNAYFVDSNHGCTACVDNCTSCQNGTSCTTCLTTDYLFSTNVNKCLLCQDTFNNCITCSNTTGNIQCQTCNTSLIKNVSSNADYNTACFSYCGDGIIQSPQECDDQNNVDSDGCNSKCEIQQSFNCTEKQNTDYPAYNISQCFYADQIIILKTYLEKYPDQNKVSFRFNFQPNLPFFLTKLFQQRMSGIISILWDGYKTNTLEVFKVQNGLYKNGLFAITFQYEKQWKDVEITLDLANTNLSMFTTNPSRRLLLQFNQNQEIKQKRLRILQTSGSGQTPTSNLMLPQTCDNNLVMYSDSYSMYTLTRYISYFLTCIIWIYWLIGLFYGKMVVIDFILVIQLVLLCCITTEKLTPGFSGMMLDNFVFYSFTGLLSINYQARSIYENLSPQLKSANISNNSFQNLSLMIGITLIIILIGLLSKIISKIWKDKKYVCDLIFKYAFGEFLLYGLLPFILIGSISTVLQVQNVISGNNEIQIINVLAVVVFNILLITMLVLGIVKTQILGQFRTHFLRFDISQYFYIFALIYIAVVGYTFSLIFGTGLSQFGPILPIIIFASIIIFNILKRPYLQNRNHLRIYLLYGFGITFMTLILVTNIVSIQMLKSYLPCVIVFGQSLLAIITGYFLFKAIKKEGMIKFSSFIQQKKMQKTMCQSKQFDENCCETIKQYKINSATIDYYEKQSKILQNIKKNILPSAMDYQQQYKNLNTFIQNNSILQNNNQQQQIVNTISEEQRQKTTNLLQNSKFLKISLKSHLINQASQHFRSVTSGFNNQFQGQQFNEQKQRQNQKQQKINYKSKSKQKSQQVKNQVKAQNNNHKDFRTNLISDVNLQQFPEQLITSYKISDLFKKTDKKQYRNNLNQSKQLQILKQRNTLKQNSNNSSILLEQLLSQPIEKVNQITYQELVRQLQEDERQQNKNKNK